MEREGREALCESLRQNADLTEKSFDFMLDPEQVDEAKADVALWREAADEIERLRGAIQYVIDNSPGTPDSVKGYLARRLA